MIKLPVFEHLSVQGYGLYPGTAGQPGLSASFQPGLTLILGANGLGKSTLVLLLFRMCTGPADIAGFSGQPELGYRQLRVSSLSSQQLKAFATRVHDGAKGATATLSFSLGTTSVSVTRDLRNLALRGFTVNGTSQPIAEDEYRKSIAEITGLNSFIDWLLILRYLVFYFEDRRSLVWDPTAQRHLLRLLFLPPDETEAYLALEREVLSKDSEVRNLQAVVNKQDKHLKSEEKSFAERSELEREISRLAKLHDEDSARLTVLQDSLNELDAQRQTTRVETLKAAEERESAYRLVEHQRLLEIATAFPTHSESALYIVSQLLAGDSCLVCGTDVPDFAQQLRERIDASRCVICASSVRNGAASEYSSVSIQDALNALKMADEHLMSASDARSDAEAAYRATLTEMRQLENAISATSARLDALIKRLPASDQELRQRRREFNQMHARIETMKEELNEIRVTYAERIERANFQVAMRHTDVKAAFDSHAHDFLVEACALIWSTHTERVGQSGDPIGFSVFEVDMTGTDFNSPVRRNGAEQVSESQREFIDLAFRMALMNVAGEGGVGTLIVDAPESSLDAVFAPRAARVLTQFGNPESDNRVILTSNLVDGELIPTLLRNSRISSTEDPRVVDLIQIASPTAAITKLRDEYSVALQRIFDKATNG
ncbi:AAA family ATPase [Nonomuraea sp. NPDC050383]|uniref:AAA family ATPase n=1 Tax=Nonomuraea sp. NPDC050383 TaxID=3364362 RepID=UPI0037905DB0